MHLDEEQERTAVELHATVTGAPLSVVTWMSFATIPLAAGMNIYVYGLHRLFPEKGLTCALI